MGGAVRCVHALVPCVLHHMPHVPNDERTTCGSFFPACLLRSAGRSLWIQVRTSLFILFHGCYPPRLGYIYTTPLGIVICYLLLYFVVLPVLSAHVKRSR